jgi:hypothetical protein
MDDIVRPGIGIILGVLIIILKRNISKKVETYYMRFPKYKDGFKALNLELYIRPFFIGALGYILIILSLYSIFYQILS